MKLIRVANNLYTQLSDQADLEQRSITKQLEIVLDAYYDSTAPHSVCSGQATPITRRQVERINGVRINLAGMSVVELQVLTHDTGERFKQAYAEFDIVRGALHQAEALAANELEAHKQAYLSTPEPAA